MAKKIINDIYTTDFSFAERYIEDRRFPKWERVKVKFPLVEERDAPNWSMDYQDQYWHRSFRGKAPIPEYYAYDKLNTSELSDLSSSEYKFKSDANNGSNVPVGYYATSSGIYPIDFIPFTKGEPSDHPTYISEEDTVNSITSGVEFIVGKNIKTPTMITGSYPYRYLAGSNIGRFEWNINPNYETPTWPETRFPNGATRKKK